MLRWLFCLWLVFALAIAGLSTAEAGTTTFSTPGAYSYTVPAGVTRLRLQVAGGGGGGGGYDNTTPGNGGTGALITMTLNVTPGQVVNGTVGAGGITGWTGGAASPNGVGCVGGGAGGSGFGSGGTGGNANCPAAAGYSGGGGGGGGSTTLILAGTNLAQAAGGGGGGGSTMGAVGGNGGSSSGVSVVATCGTIQNGGTGGSYTGDGGGGGGGGAGYVAGAGGAAAADTLSPGGGGAGTSCYSSNAAVVSASVTAAGGAGAVGQTLASSTSSGAGGNGSVTVTEFPTLTITMISTGGVGGFTFTGTNGWTSQTITTASSGVGVAGPKQTFSATATATTITEAIPAGYTMTAASCSGLGSGGTMTPNLSAGTLSFDAASIALGSDITCTVTNTKTPIFALQVTSLAGFGGPLHFSQTNLASTPADISPSAQGTLDPASPTPINVSTIGTAITVSQIVEYRYDIIGVSCTDSNSAITGNTGSFGTLSGSLGFETITIPSAKVVAGATFTCVLTVKRIPRIVISSVTLGGSGATTFTLPTNQSPQTITTTAANSAVSGISSYFNALATASTVTVTPIANYTLTSVTCSDTDPNGPWGTGSISVNTGAATFAFPASMIVYGANYACTVTTSKTPTLKLQKITYGSSGVAFSFSQTNLASTPSSITTASTGVATPASPTAIAISNIGTAVTLTEAAVSGWFISSASCTDANSAITGNTGSIGTLAGNVLTLASGNVVAGADFTCVFSNTLGAPNLTISKTFSPAGPFAVGQVVTYTYTVTNTGNVAMTNVQVKDMHGSPAVLVSLGAGGITNETLTGAGTGGSFDTTPNDGIWSSLAPGATITFTWAHTVTQAEIDHG